MQDNQHQNKRNYDIQLLTLILISSTICGLVFMYSCSSVPYLLKIRNYNLNTILCLDFIFIAPYNAKIIISILINKFILRARNQIQYITRRLILLQITICALICVATNMSNLASTTASILSAISLITVQDILVEHIRLRHNPSNSIAFSTTISTTGFRIGNFIGGVIALKSTSMFLWCICILCALGVLTSALISTRKTSDKIDHNSNRTQEGRMTYKHLISMIFSRFSLTILTFLILHRYADTFIHTLKPIILPEKGFNNIDSFTTNIQANNFLCVIAANIVMSLFANKINSSYRITMLLKVSTLLQIIPSIFWIAISSGSLSVTTITVMISMSSVIFFTSNNSLRIYLSHISERDVNRYILLTSIISIARQILIGLCLICFRAAKHTDTSSLCTTLFIIACAANILCVTFMQSRMYKKDVGAYN